MWNYVAKEFFRDDSQQRTPRCDHNICGVTFLDNNFDGSQSGAVMVMALFAGIFLVALLYHIIGVGQASVESQMAQGAADSLTYGAATVKARGMNTIVLLNLLMATVLSVLVAIRLVEVLIVVAIAAVGVACVFTGGAACGAIAPLAKAEHELHNYSKKIEENIKPILQGLEKAGDVINKAVPVLAEAEAVYMSRVEGQPVSKIGFVWPIVDALPTQKGSFEELCEQAGKQVVKVSTFFLPGNLPKKANEIVGELLGNMAGKFTRFFCGGGDAPSHTRKEDVAYPSSSNIECDSAAANPTFGHNGCNNSLCEQCAQKACTECVGRMEMSSFQKARWFYTEEKWIEVMRDDGILQVAQQWPKVSETKWLSTYPCDEPANCTGSKICSTEERIPDDRYGPHAIQVTRIEYKLIYGCVVAEEIELEQSEAIDGDGWPKPRVLDDDAERDDFRVWGVGLGVNNSESRQNGVGALYGLRATSLFDARFNVASAEFTSTQGDLWHMDWYSRLIRFRMPDGGLSKNGCGGANAQVCERASGVIKRLKQFTNSQMVH